MTMTTTAIGSTSTGVSALGLGAAPIGNLFSVVDQETALATVATAWDGGVRYFDTAPHYGLGLSERRLGEALKAHPRGDYVVSTKVGRLLVPNPRPTGSDLASGGFAVPDSTTRVRDYSRDGVLRSLEASLARLDTDRIDIVYIHDPDDFMDEAVAEAAPALSALRDEGVIGAYGAGMNDWRLLHRLVETTDMDVVMVAGRWTLLDRSAAPLLELCRAKGVAVVAAAPFNSGMLAQDPLPDDATFDYEPASVRRMEQARRLAAECRRFGVALPQAALQFPLRHPAVVAVVAGMRSVAEAATDVTWLSEPIGAAAWSALEGQPA
jgi:D-threo-aldose 1-dehydrogenase